LTAEGLQGLYADELPFPVVVRGEDRLVRVLGQAPQGVVQGWGRLQPHGLRVDQPFQVRRLPVLQVGRIVDLDDMASQGNDDEFTVSVRESEIGDAILADPFRLPFG
jgi:hypothetical protein